jgi:Transferase family
VTALPQLRESRMIQTGHPTPDVVLCGVTDTMMATLTVSVVFFFAGSLDVARLTGGLATALARLPVFAGRLQTTDAGLQIVCDDSGAALSVYDAGETLSEAIGRVTLPGSGLVEHVDARLARTGGAPLLTVRVSALADGGTAIGCSWQHAVGDMHSFLILMRAWSAAVEGTELPEPFVVADRDGYLDQMLPARDSGRPGIRVPAPDEAIAIGRELESALMSARISQIYFTEAETSRMRDAYSAAAGQRLSINDVLCAQVVTTIRRLNSDTEARNLALAVDIRERFGLPPETVGNLTNEIYLTCQPDSPPERVASQIRDAIGSFADSHLSFRANREFLATIGGRSRLESCVPVAFDLGRQSFTFNSWRRFGLYDLAFCGQRPAFFSASPNVAVPWNSWVVEGFNNTGYLFTVGLPARLASRLRSPDGRAALHGFRADDEVLPELAAAARKLI